MGRPPRRHPGTPHPPQCAHWGTFPPSGGKAPGTRCAPLQSGQLPAGCEGHPGPSAAWHRRRPGGPGRYNAAAVRDCRVIDAGRPRRGSACHETKKGTGRGCTPGSCFVCTAFRRHEPPYWGGQGGRSPPALLSPHFFGKKWGRPPRRHPPGGWASTRRADTIRPYGLGSWRTALVRPAPRGRARFRTKKRAARDTGGACVYRSSRKYAKPRLAGGCLSRLLRREVKISTTTVTT